MSTPMFGYPFCSDRFDDNCCTMHCMIPLSSRADEQAFRPSQATKQRRRRLACLTVPPMDSKGQRIQHRARLALSQPLDLEGGSVVQESRQV